MTAETKTETAVLCCLLSGLVIVLSCLILPYLALSCVALLCLVLSCVALPCLFMRCVALSCLLCLILCFSGLVWSSLVLSCECRLVSRLVMFSDCPVLPCLLLVCSWDCHVVYYLVLFRLVLRVRLSFPSSDGNRWFMVAARKI